MAVTINKYNSFLLGQMNGTPNAVVDFDTDTLKLQLCSAAYVPNAATQVWLSDVSNEVATSAQYAAGGKVIATPTVALSGGTVTFDGADVTWLAGAAGFANARYGVIYKSTGTASTSRLIAYIDFGADKTNIGGDFSVVWSATGIVTWA